MTQLFNKQDSLGTRRELRKGMPKGEKVLWQHIKNKQLGFKFRRQFSIDKYIVDFYCTKARVVIEVDGITHQSETAAERDRQRDLFLRQKGLHILRYTSSQIRNDLDAVKQDIINTCQVRVRD